MGAPPRRRGGRSASDNSSSVGCRPATTDRQRLAGRLPGNPIQVERKLAPDVPQTRRPAASRVAPLAARSSTASPARARIRSHPPDGPQHLKTKRNPRRAPRPHPASRRPDPTPTPQPPASQPGPASPPSGPALRPPRSTSHQERVRRRAGPAVRSSSGRNGGMTPMVRTACLRCRWWAGRPLVKGGWIRRSVRMTRSVFCCRPDRDWRRRIIWPGRVELVDETVDLEPFLASTEGGAFRL